MKKGLEVEVKVALEEAADTVDAELRSAGAAPTAPPELEDDRLFDDDAGTLHGRDQVLRLRRRGARCWLTFKGPARNRGDLKVREERETTVEDGEALEAILVRVGFHPVVRYQKVRARYRLDGVELCLDRTPAGLFLELEGDPEGIGRVASRLGIARERFDRRDYLEIWRQRGEEGDMVFEGEADAEAGTAT